MPRLSVHDDGRGEPAGERVKQERAAHDAAVLARLFVLESLNDQPDRRRKRILALVEVLVEMNRERGGELFDVVETVRAEWEQAGRFGA